MKSTFLLALFLVAILGVNACVPHQGLRLEQAPADGLSGSFSLILFGCRYLDDPETVAILDREDDGYMIEPFSPEFNYRVEKGLSAEKALEQARRFINCHTSVNGARLSSIVDDKGVIFGYELRPLYFPLTYGVDDILLTDYWMRGDRIIVRIGVIPSVERMIAGGSSDKNN